jgi:glucokinase
MAAMGRALTLAGDVGGTKTYLALFDATDPSYIPLTEARYNSQEFVDLGALLTTYLNAHSNQHPARIVLGIPGSVRQLPVKPVNLPWNIDPDALTEALGIEIVLLNDLQATAYGTQALKPEDYVLLNPGPEDPQGNIAVIAAGTGLGEGGLCWNGTGFTAVASEGGHASFAPNSSLETELWRYLNNRFGHVSWERLVSGPGLAHIYDFLKDSGHYKEPEWLTQELAQDDRSDTISQIAMAGRNPLAQAALDLFVRLYGAETGNLALQFMATGGVFVGGGIVPKILPKLKAGPFMEAFLAKGRLQEMLEEIPVKLILNDKAGLLGAAYWGAHLYKNS